MLRALVHLGLAAVFILTAAGFIAPAIPAFEFANHVRPAVVAVSALVVLLSLGSPGWPARTVAVGFFAINAVLFLLPFLWSASIAGHAGQAAYPRQLKLITFNMWQANRSGTMIAEFLLNEDADIVLLQELSASNAQVLATRLGARYPHAHIRTEHGACSQAIFSKRPWIEAGHVRRRSGNPEMVWARFRNEGSSAFRVQGVHAAYPFTPGDQARHNERLIAFSKAVLEPLILAGDLNLTPWSYKLQRLCWETGLRRHATLLASWTLAKSIRWLPPAFLIDHVLSTPEIETVSIAIGPDLGSDHRPVIARLRLPR